MVLTLRRAASTLRGMDDLGHTLNAMDSTRLLLVLLFVAAYCSAIGRLASDGMRRFSLGAAALSGLAFVALTNPWVHGALLVVFVVVGVGGFVALAWALSAAAMRLQVTVAVKVPAVIAHAAGLTRVSPASLVWRQLRRARRRFSVLLAGST